jgi:hypothetical protein
MRAASSQKLIFIPEVYCTVIYTSNIVTASDLTIVLINFGILWTNFLRQVRVGIHPQNSYFKLPLFKENRASTSSTQLSVCPT